ncbi:MAG: hypothetical protein ACK424_02285, partial [Candidatus Thermochlorobacter sp.]
GAGLAISGRQQHPVDGLPGFELHRTHRAGEGGDGLAEVRAEDFYTGILYPFKHVIQLKL